MIGVAIFVGVYLLLFLTSPVIALFHELGHAIAYLIFTRPDNIDVYVGAYAKKSTDLNFKIGKLHFFFHFSLPFIKGIGYCNSSKMETNYVNDIIILLAGPIFSLLTACIFSYVVFNYEMHGAIKLYCFALIVFAVISLFINLWPRKIASLGFLSMYNDGKQIFFVLKIRKVYLEYVSAFADYNNKEYADAASRLKTVIEYAPKDENLQRLLAFCYYNLGNYEDALKYFAGLKQTGGMQASDYLMEANMFIQAKNTEAAYENYRSVLEIDKNNLIALVYVGQELAHRNEYPEAEQLLKKAIKINPAHSWAYGVYGYLKMLMGEMDAGRSLIETSLNIEKTSSGYIFLSIYYIHVNNKDEALINLYAAKKLDDTIDVESYLERLQN